MTRNTQNYWIDWVLFLAMIFLLVSGVVLWGWSRPKEPGQLPQIFWGLMEGREFLGMGKKLWKETHCWVGVGMIPFFLLHILFHVKWITKTTLGLMTRKKV